MQTDGMTINVPITDNERQAIGEMANRLELPPDRVMIQALRIYQMVVIGGAKVTMPDSGLSKCGPLMDVTPGMIDELKAACRGPKDYEFVASLLGKALSEGRISDAGRDEIEHAAEVRRLQEQVHNLRQLLAATHATLLEIEQERDALRLELENCTAV